MNVYMYIMYMYIYIMMIYENIWKWRKLFSSWASLPIPYTHLLLQSLKTAVFFFPSVPTPSPKPRSSLKKCRQNDSTHRFGFPWRWAEKQKIFEILHLWFFVKFSASDEIERGFLSQFFLAPFQNHGWAKCTHKGNCTGNPSCRSQRSANGRPWHKKKRDNSPRETQRQEPQGTPELRVKKYPFRVS